MLPHGAAGTIRLIFHIAEHFIQNRQFVILIDQSILIGQRNVFFPCKNRIRRVLPDDLGSINQFLVAAAASCIVPRQCGLCHSRREPFPDELPLEICVQADYSGVSLASYCAPFVQNFFNRAIRKAIIRINADIQFRVDHFIGSIVGGVILPSPALSLSALVRNTAQLPQIDMELPAKRFLGTNTTDCLHSGIVNGSALMLDGLFARCRATLHAPDAPVIATGTLPASIRDACATPIEYNGTLILDGLYSIWKRNVKK